MYRATKIKNVKTSHQKLCESEKDGATFLKVLKEKKEKSLSTKNSYHENNFQK